MKRTAMFLICGLLILAGTASLVSAAMPLNFKLDGLFSAFRTQPVIQNNVTFMAMRELAGYLDAVVAWKDSTQTATLTKGDKSLILTINSKKAVLNGVAVDIPAAPMYNKGQVMSDILVPMRFVAENFGGVVGWEENTRTIALTTGKDPLAIMEINQPTTANAIVIGYNEALKNALAAHSTLLNLDESYSLLNEQHKNLVDDIRLLAYVSDLDSQVFIDALRGLRQIEEAMGNIPFNEQMIRESTEFMLRNQLSAIASDEMDLQMLNEQLNLQATNLKNLKLKLELGMASKADVTEAEQNLEQLKVNQQTLSMIIADQRSSLGKILKLPMDREVIVNFEPSDVPLSQPSVDALVATLSNDPMLKIKQSAIDEAQYALDTFTDSQSESKLEKQTKLQAASRDYDDTKRNLESGIRSTYNKLRQIRESQRALEIDLQKAKDMYTKASVNYQAGYVTLYELDASKLGILSAESAIAKNEYIFWTLNFGLEHPYLLLAPEDSK
jgi:hypothetical protein